MFRVYLFDGQGLRHDLGDVKIGFKGQMNRLGFAGGHLV